MCIESKLRNTIMQSKREILFLSPKSKKKKIDKFSFPVQLRGIFNHNLPDEFRQRICQTSSLVENNKQRFADYLIWIWFLKCRYNNTPYLDGDKWNVFIQYIPSNNTHHPYRSLIFDCLFVDLLLAKIIQKKQATNFHLKLYLYT